MMNNVLKISSKLFLILLILTAYLLNPLAVDASSANTLAGMRAELEKLKEEKKDSDNDVKYTQSEINAKNSQIASSQTAIINAREERDLLDQQITETNVKIAELEEETKKILVLFEQITSQESYLEYVTGASNLTELIMRSDAINQIIDYNNNKLKELGDLINSNKEKNLELIEKEEDLEEDIVKLEVLLSDLKGDLSAFSEITEGIDNQIKNQETLIDYYESLGCEENEQLSACVDELGNNSIIFKPFETGKVSSSFGYRYIWGKYSMHYGVDISKAEGTPIYAAASGRVAAITVKDDCGGNKVYVHVLYKDEPHTTAYLHLLRVDVKVGDIISVNTQIGLVGGGSGTPWDDCSTGSHLHFQIATGYYLGGASASYSSYSTFQARSFAPPNYPAKYGWFYSRT